MCEYDLGDIWDDIKSKICDDCPVVGKDPRLEDYECPSVLEDEDEAFVIIPDKEVIVCRFRERYESLEVDYE